MTGYPMKLSCVEKSAIWGGQRLIREFDKPAHCDPLAECWELTVREKECCTVENGAFAGRSLAEALEELGSASLGKGFSGGRFPLLVKLIDAADDLSVQVHPDDAFAAREGDCGKTEMWHIVSAEPGASILYGMAEGVGTAELAQALEQGELDRVVHRRAVHAGETYFIPAGMLHAIGKGILVAEIQQNCDLTYRVYDYGRIGADGKPRQLHLEKALEVIRSFSDAEVDAIRYAGGDHSALADCPYFTVHRMELAGEWSGSVAETAFQHLLFLDGEGSLRCGGADYPWKKGDSYLLPAGLGAYSLTGRGSVLASSPTAGC